MVVGGRVAEDKEDPFSEAQCLGRVFFRGKEWYKHRIVPVSQLVCLTPAQVSGRALLACVKVVALSISCKQAKSSLGENHKAWQGRRDSFKTLLSFDNHTNKTSGGKSIPNKKFNKSKEIFKATEANS